MRSTLRRLATSLGVLVLISAVATGQTLQLEKTVAANGGGTSAAGSLTIESTSGQPFAGGFLTGPRGSSYIGFWTPQFAPTAAGVTVSGRATTMAGHGLTNITVTLANANGEVWIARTSSFGYYRLEMVPAGNTYLLTASAKRYVFSNSPRVISVDDEISDLDLVAIEP